ncbi:MULTISPECIES: hypothetical protein [Streptomyces]|uniref:hypothetical protein n=1 Tax=Streptomyces TaxID=1883 RepID=UPI0022489F05|nr:hypothetical protein [Streptomyces sp. JHD 1]MCX2969141.1 hypothetical protein [Streptomyces sp. JHD 1]
MSTSRLRPLTVAAAACALTLGLGACGSADATTSPAPSPSPHAATWSAPAHAEAVRALGGQAEDRLRAAEEAARRAAAEKAGVQAQQRSRTPASSSATPRPCTTAPEDRAACVIPPGAEFSPDGGDVDGDGIFEDHEPVGPGAQDPRAYDGGRTSGETQCAWLRQQGVDC